MDMDGGGISLRTDVASVMPLTSCSLLVIVQAQSRVETSRWLHFQVPCQFFLCRFI